MRGLHELPARDRTGAFRVVVESPRGSGVKLKYEPDVGAFTFDRELVLGLSYPFHWGFVPGTRAADGDPLDAFVLHEAATYPGVVVTCRALAVIELEQNAKEGGKRIRNDRVVAEPIGSARESELGAGRLTARVRRELEEFFVSATLFQNKEVRILGWGDAKAAEALVDSARAGAGQAP